MTGQIRTMVYMRYSRHIPVKVHGGEGGDEQVTSVHTSCLGILVMLGVVVKGAQEAGVYLSIYLSLFFSIFLEERRGYCSSYCRRTVGPIQFSPPR